MAGYLDNYPSIVTVDSTSLSNVAHYFKVFAKQNKTSISISMDNDGPGRDAEKSMFKMLVNKLNLPESQVRFVHPLPFFKDWGDMYANDPKNPVFKDLLSKTLLQNLKYNVQLSATL